MIIDSKDDEVLWAQKYRPKTIEDAILPKRIKELFQKFIDNKEIPNLLLSGPPGMGKTTAAYALLNELGIDYIKINGSLENGIDTLRTKIANFASTVSFMGGRKFVIIDEADRLTPATQDALRSFMEEYSKNCGFIFTCNFKQRIIAPLRESRFSVIDFAIENTEKPGLAVKFYKRVVGILNQESIEYQDSVIAKIVEKYFPDFRRTLNELQKYATLGKIDESILLKTNDEDVSFVFALMKDKKFTDLRKWVSQNADRDYIELFRALYEMSIEKIVLKSMPAFVILMADYQFKHSQVADPEINLLAMFSELMLECEFK